MLFNDELHDFERIFQMICIETDQYNSGELPKAKVEGIIENV